LNYNISNFIILAILNLGDERGLVPLNKKKKKKKKIGKHEHLIPA